MVSDEVYLIDSMLSLRYRFTSQFKKTTLRKVYLIDDVYFTEQL